MTRRRRSPGKAPGCATRAPAVLALLLACAPFAAQARLITEVRPRVALAAGYDDNVRFDGAGGDALGEVVPGLKLDVWGEHHLRLDTDCEASLARLRDPNQFAGLGDGTATSAVCRLDFRDRPGETLQTHWTARASYARDAFAISSLGLLLRAGQTQVFAARLTGGFTSEISTRGAIEYGLYADALDFGSNDPGNGVQLAPQVGYSHKLSLRSTVDVTAREQLFFGTGATEVPGLHLGADSGLLAEGTAALFGFTHQLSPTMTAVIRAGPELLNRRGLPALGFVAGRIELSDEFPRSGLHAVLAHDLVLGPSRAGALVGDLAEVGGFAPLPGPFSMHGRAGVYRNADASVEYSQAGTVGYSVEAGLDLHLSREWALGFAGLRDARLTDRFGINVDRDVFQIRIAWERAHE